jgi:prefoldin subunit 5
MDPIDERLDRLTARHEALTESVESLLASVTELRASHEALTGSVQSLLATAERDGENIRALARIAEIHERRLTELEGGSGGKTLE